MATAEALAASKSYQQPKIGLRGVTEIWLIVVIAAVAVIPGFQTARRLSLDTRGVNLQVSCVTKQGLPVTVRAVVNCIGATAV
ncbi:hypothetical protein ABZU76_00915 [Amycolatopsis sp. NPDC005232]|uniref:hypothetical protein n=1 Tax=Amycolatopsis sp. NPDC005232 TaxID=3157027 RepID=UPI0033B58799